MGASFSAVYPFKPSVIRACFVVLFSGILYAMAEAKPDVVSSAMAALPLGAIVPAGWLKNQMQLQAGAITGILEEIWPDVGPDSGWLGGKGESWERGPYYLDGLVPLAYQLNDKRLIAKVVIVRLLEHLTR